MEMATGGGRVTALAANLPVTNGAELVDSVVRIRGVCTTRFNLQRQLFDSRVLVPRPEDLTVVTPAPKDPFAVPTRPMEQLLQFTPQGSYGHRVKVRGTVIYYGEDALYIEDKTEGVCIESRQGIKVLPGEQIEALGFPANGEYTPMLQDAVYRKVAAGDLPVPDRVTKDDALSGKHDCRLVRIEATVLDRARHSREQFLVLQAQGFIFHAYLQRNGTGTDFAYLENDSKVAITGVCLIERGPEWYYGTDWTGGRSRFGFCCDRRGTLRCCSGRRFGISSGCCGRWGCWAWWCARRWPGWGYYGGGWASRRRSYSGSCRRRRR
jgi:hypothetical protein